MNKKKTLLLTALLAGGAAALLAVAFLLPPARTNWPQFPEPTNGEPQVVVVVEPDFGYHIGDEVPVDIYVRQPTGTAVDIGSLAMEGDFEVRGEPKVTRAPQTNGEQYIHIRVVLQSLSAFKPQYTSKLNMTWEAPGDRVSHPIATPEISVGASNTWDGRDVVQKGKLPFWYGNHLAWTIAMMATGVVGFIGLWLWSRAIRRGMPRPPKRRTPLSPRAKAKARFDKVWAKIRAGDQSESHFRVIDVLVRQLERIEHVLLDDVPMSVGDAHPRLAQIMHILQQCEEVIYKGTTLTNEQLDSLELAFNIYVGVVAIPEAPDASPSPAAEAAPEVQS